MSNPDVPSIDIQIIISPSGQPERPFNYFCSTLCEASDGDAEGLEGRGSYPVSKMKDGHPSRETETKQKHSR